MRFTAGLDSLTTRALRPCFLFEGTRKILSQANRDFQRDSRVGLNGHVCISIDETRSAGTAHMHA